MTPADDPHTQPPAMESGHFPCASCGADLRFAPGTHSLVCPYCGAANEIAVADEPLVERDYRAHLARARSETELYEVMTVKCEQCGSETTLDPNVTADVCAFCGTSYVQTAKAQRLFKPQALLPFKVAREEAHEAFRKWIRSRWFAPNDLKRLARREGGIRGMYIPYWTYDAETDTSYVGRRGEHYWVNETYTTTENGKTVQRTRRVRKTRWYPASGRVHDSFDDVLVVASTTLPRKHMEHLEPWDLDALVPYADAFQSGFRTESYSVDLESGFGRACEIMDVTIYATIRRDIGGDEQQVLSKNTAYRDVTFKHILLPVWISAYRYREKTYRFLVNARTGEVQGDRPWSWVKITLLVLFILLVVAVVVVLKNS